MTVVRLFEPVPNRFRVTCAPYSHHKIVSCIFKISCAIDLIELHSGHNHRALLQFPRFNPEVDQAIKDSVLPSQ